MEGSCGRMVKAFLFTGVLEYTGTYVLVKSVECKVPTALAYDVARSSVGCQLRCQSRHLTAVLNYEANVAVLKLCMRLEIGRRKCSNQTKENAGRMAEWLGI